MVSSEYDAFQRIAEGLNMARDGALAMARLRPDQRWQWEKMAEVYKVSLNAIYKLAEESVARMPKS